LEEANAVVVAPLWPTQPWFTRLMEMLVDQPILIRRKKDMSFNESLVLFLEDDIHDAISTPTVFLEKPCSLYLFLTHDISLVSEFSGVNERWIQYCNNRNISFLQPDLDDALQFLTDLFETGLSYSSLNTARNKD
jgi:hypothetical protein